MAKELEQIFNKEKGIFVNEFGDEINKVMEIGYTHITSDKTKLDSAEIYEKAKSDFNSGSIKMFLNPSFANAYSIEGSSTIKIVDGEESKTKYSYLLYIWKTCNE